MPCGFVLSARIDIAAAVRARIVQPKPWGELDWVLPELPARAVLRHVRACVTDGCVQFRVCLSEWRNGCDPAEWCVPERIVLPSWFVVARAMPRWNVQQRDGDGKCEWMRAVSAWDVLLER